MSLEKLKELRKRRMEGASIALRKSKEHLLICEQAVFGKQNELQQYAQWRLQHQDDLFTQLQSNSFSPEDLGRYMSDIDGLKIKKQQIEEELETARLKYQQAGKSIQERKMALSLITKKLEKLSEIIDMKKKELSSGDSMKEEDAVDEIVAFRATAR